MHELLAALHGVRAQVVKTRTLYLVGRTRVHVDAVENLGNFVELEVVLRPGEDPREGEREAHELMAALGISPDQLVAHAYVDLLESREAHR